MQSLLDASGPVVTHYEIVKDEPAQILALFERLSQDAATQVILLNGGTGIAPRDTTFGAIAALLTKMLPGFGEIFRQLSRNRVASNGFKSDLTQQLSA